MARTLLFILRQVALVGLAIVAYFGVRGLTEGEMHVADRNADQVLRFEQALGMDIERGLQSLLLDHHALVTMANWIYIWAHWPVVIATLVFLALRHRDQYFELRNAMFISGAIGLVIYASFAVTPPRLFAADYIDTVTQHSTSYRVFQPPALVNKFAAVPSLHFGWNLLVGLTWYRVGWVLGRRQLARVAAFVMPIAMAFAVVATANHWTFDVVSGAAVALAGLAIERLRPHGLDRWLVERLAATRLGALVPVQLLRRLAPDLGEALNRRDRRQDQHQPQYGLEEWRDGQADGEGDDPLGPLHEPALGVEPKRLGLGSLIGDQPGEPHHCDW